MNYPKLRRHFFSKILTTEWLLFWIWRKWFVFPTIKRKLTLRKLSAFSHNSSYIQKVVKQLTIIMLTTGTKWMSRVCRLMPSSLHVKDHLCQLLMKKRLIEWSLMVMLKAFISPNPIYIVGSTANHASIWLPQLKGRQQASHRRNQQLFTVRLLPTHYPWFRMADYSSVHWTTPAK
jgi:hypothetical protein